MRLKLRFLRGWLACRRHGHSRLVIEETVHNGERIRCVQRCARCRARTAWLDTRAIGPRPRPFRRRRLGIRI